MEPRGPSQEVRTQKRNRSPGRGHLRAQAHPTLRAAGGPSALGPADPAAPGPVTQFLFCPTGLRPSARCTCLLAQVSQSPKGGRRRVQAPLLARTSGPAAARRPDPTPRTPSTHPFPGAAVSGGPPRLLRAPRRAPPCLGGPHARSHPGLLGGASRVAGRKGGLGEGGSGSGPTCISVPAVSSGGGGSSRSLPLPPPRGGLPARLCAGSGTPLPSPEAATIERSGREGHLHAHFRRPPAPRSAEAEAVRFRRPRGQSGRGAAASPAGGRGRGGESASEKPLEGVASRGDAGAGSSERRRRFDGARQPRAPGPAAAAARMPPRGAGPGKTGVTSVRPREEAEPGPAALAPRGNGERLDEARSPTRE